MTDKEKKDALVEESTEEVYDELTETEGVEETDATDEGDASEDALDETIQDDGVSVDDESDDETDEESEDDTDEMDADSIADSIVDEIDIDVDEEEMTGSTKKGFTKKQKQKGKIAIFIIEIVVLLALIGALIAWTTIDRLYNKIQQDSEFKNESEAGISTEIPSEHMEILKGYTNIALFGLDNRSTGDYDQGRSDVIIVASINNETHDVKLLSVYRDTYLNVGNGKYNKCNAAYSGGGVRRAVQMLNTNLDLDITEYVCVDWTAVTNAINALGGIDLELTKAEVKQLNKYLDDVNRVTGSNSPYLSGKGLMHLDGAQATTYARIRKTSGSDFKRSSRQRIVIEAMLNKAKKADIPTLLKMCEAIFSDISTTLTLPEIIDLAKDIQSYSIESTTGFPFKMTTKRLSGSGDCVIPIDFADNVSQLHKYLFGTEDYKPTSTVQAISDTIIDKTGVDEDTPSYNVDSFNDTAGQDGTKFDD